MFFAAMEFLPQAIKGFSDLLDKELAVLPKSKAVLSRKLAVIHNEFNIIHPFREGNGRTIRLFLDLVSVCSGFDPIDWGVKNQKAYFSACDAGTKGNNKPLEKIIKKGLKKVRKNKNPKI